MQPYVNPVNDFYFRNAQAQMQMPVYQQNFPPVPQQPQIKTYFVTGIEEASAAMIDPLATNIFLDTSSGRIYMKNMGNDGKPQFLCYSIEEQTVPKDPIEEINYRLTNIEKTLGGIKYDKSISGNAGIEQSTAVSRPAITRSYATDDEAESTGLSEDAGDDQRQIRSRNETDLYESGSTKRHRP
jgi:hypothetical protein